METGEFKVWAKNPCLTGVYVYNTVIRVPILIIKFNVASVDMQYTYFVPHLKVLLPNILRDCTHKSHLIHLQSGK